MKHAILGAGGVGGLVGTALASLGEDVIVVVQPDKLANYPEKLTLDRPTGTMTAEAHAVSKLTEPVDVLWIATRIFQLQGRARIGGGSAEAGGSSAQRSGPHRDPARSVWSR